MGEMADSYIDQYINGKWGLGIPYHKKNIKRNKMTAPKVGETKYHKWTGTMNWSHLYEPDDFMNAKNYTVDFYPEDGEAGFAAIKASGIQGKPKTDKEGNKYFRFKRPATKLIKGTIVSFAPPVIEDKDGKKLVSYNYQGKPSTSVTGNNIEFERVGEMISIGHGSKVQVDVCVYGTAYGPGNRLNGIKIIDLIEYVPVDAQAGDSESDEDPVVTGSEAAQAASGKAPW